MWRYAVSALVLVVMAPWYGPTAWSPAPHPTAETLADSWIAVTHCGDVSRIVLDSAGTGQYAFDVYPGDVRVYDIVRVTIDDYKIRIDAVSRGGSEPLTMRGEATADKIWIHWSKKDKTCFQRETRFDQSLNDLRAAMKGGSS